MISPLKSADEFRWLRELVWRFHSNDGSSNPSVSLRTSLPSQDRCKISHKTISCDVTRERSGKIAGSCPLVTYKSIMKKCRTEVHGHGFGVPESTPAEFCVFFGPGSGVFSFSAVQVSVWYMSFLKFKNCWILVASMVAGVWTGVGSKFQKISDPNPDSKIVEQERRWNLKMWLRPALVSEWKLMLVDQRSTLHSMMR